MDKHINTTMNDSISVPSSGSNVITFPEAGRYPPRLRRDGLLSVGQYFRSDTLKRSGDPRGGKGFVPLTSGVGEAVGLLTQCQRIC